jgi:hypothetical protein
MNSTDIYTNRAKIQAAPAVPVTRKGKGDSYVIKDDHRDHKLPAQTSTSSLANETQPTNFKCVPGMGDLSLMDD